MAVEESEGKEVAAGTKKNHFAELFFDFEHVELQQHLNIQSLCERSCARGVGAAAAASGCSGQGQGWGRAPGGHSGARGLSLFRRQQRALQPAVWGIRERRTGTPETQLLPSLERAGISSAAQLVLPPHRRPLRCLLREPASVTWLNSFFRSFLNDKCVRIIQS